jgi:hypothetical protein
MSVHSEYARALNALLLGLSRLDTAEARDWAEALGKARSSQNPDLSTAATLCVDVLDTIDEARSYSAEARIGPDLDPLREPYLQLRAHCRAVLGVSAEESGRR